MTLNAVLWKAYLSAWHLCKWDLEIHSQNGKHRLVMANAKSRFWRLPGCLLKFPGRKWLRYPAEITLTASPSLWLSCLPISTFIEDLQREASLVLPIVAHIRVDPGCALGKMESCWKNYLCWCNQRLLPSLWIRGQHWAKALESVHSWAFFLFFKFAVLMKLYVLTI